MPVPRNSYWKTAVCRYHQRGKCEWGQDCKHAHSEEELRKQPDFVKTRMCRLLQKSKGCPRGDKCTFAHDYSELRSSPSVYKTRMCVHPRGSCPYGENCRFLHEDEERPDLDETLVAADHSFPAARELSSLIKIKASSEAPSTARRDQAADVPARTTIDEERRVHRASSGADRAASRDTTDTSNAGSAHGEECEQLEHDRGDQEDGWRYDDPSPANAFPLNLAAVHPTEVAAPPQPMLWGQPYPVPGFQPSLYMGEMPPAHTTYTMMLPSGEVVPVLVHAPPHVG